MALLNSKLWRGEAYAGLYVRKDLDGPGTHMRYFNKSDIIVHDCKPPVTYILLFSNWYTNYKTLKNLVYQESINNKWWIPYDVALITLESQFDISLPQINPICLPKRKMFFDMDELYKEKLRIIGVQLFL